MTNNETETDLIGKIATLDAEIAEKEAERRSARTELRAAAKAADLPYVEEARSSLSAARAARDRLLAEKASLEATIAAIAADWKAGTNVFSEEDAMKADWALKRVESNLVKAEKDFNSADRAYRRVAADNHLAELVADVIESLTTTPVLLRKVPSQAPELDAAVILTQTAPTRDYGTLDAAGEVNLTLVGEANIDWQEVYEALLDLGCEVTVSPSRIAFAKATWPVPRLAEPSVTAVHHFASLFAQAWVPHVEENAQLRQAGYMNARTGLTALVSRKGESLTYEAGTAVGSVKFHLGVVPTRHGAGMTYDHIIDAAHNLVSTFRESVGGVTEAGEIAGVELVSAEKIDGAIWNSAIGFNSHGDEIHPPTVEADVAITYAYEPVKGIC